jgi:hypothetical protein
MLCKSNPDELSSGASQSTAGINDPDRGCRPHRSVRLRIGREPNYSIVVLAGMAVPPRPTHRSVSRFRPAPGLEDPVYVAVPDDGLCLNAFVVLSPPGDPSQVLLGMVDPNAPWREIGGVTTQRLAELATRWMLPSRQLFLFESPQDAAQTILREQLEVGPTPLDGPSVFSEAWTRPKPAGQGQHWDLHFVFKGSWPAGRVLYASPWLKLEFHDPARLDRARVGRGHLDVLGLAGFSVRP